MNNMDKKVFLQIILPVFALGVSQARCRIKIKFCRIFKFVLAWYSTPRLSSHGSVLLLCVLMFLVFFLAYIQSTDHQNRPNNGIDGYWLICQDIAI